jgi:Uma2 family endonuclease
LVIEISDSMLSYDRNRKASLYAAGGIQDYWIVNLVDRQLEVRRIPVQDPGQPFGARFASATVHQPGDRVAPLAAPQSAIAVADLLP